MKTNTFIYVLHLLPEYKNEKNWTEKTNEIISEHFTRLKHLKDEGQVVLAGKTGYSVDNSLNFGIVVFYANSLDSAKEFMDNDPAIIRNIMTAELHPFSLSLLINE